MKTIGIIGLGNVGRVLSQYIIGKSRDLKLDFICSKNTYNIMLEDTEWYLNNIIYKNIKADITDIETLADIVFLTCKDKDIESKAKLLAEQFKEQLKDKIIIHTSGAYGLKLLNDCKKYSAICVAAHPFQTFLSKDVSCLSGIAWGIEISDNNYKKDIENLIKKLDGNPIFLPPGITENKALYHCVAVAVSNYIAGAIKLGVNIADKIELDKNDFLVPIIKQTIENCLNSIAKNDNEFPLTGPIVRNDTETIKRHIEALKDDPKLKDAYIGFMNGVKNIVE